MNRLLAWLEARRLRRMPKMVADDLFFRRRYEVIENSAHRSVFMSARLGIAHDPDNGIDGYIPSEVFAAIVGVPRRDGSTTWISREQSEAMRIHPEWIPASKWKKDEEVSELVGEES